MIEKISKDIVYARAYPAWRLEKIPTHADVTRALQVRNFFTYTKEDY